MNERAANAHDAVTAPGRRFPSAESSTWPGAEVYSVDPETGVMLQVTADTLAALGGGYMVYGSGAAWLPSRYAAEKWIVGGMEGAGFRTTYSKINIIESGALAAPSARAMNRTLPERTPEETKLIDAIKSIFPNASIATKDKTDAEEGWPVRVIEVHTGLNDPEKLTEAENNFYDLVAAHETLIATLRVTTVSFR